MGMKSSRSMSSPQTRSGKAERPQLDEFIDLHTLRQPVAVDLDGVIGEGTRWRIVVDRLVDLVECTIDVAVDAHPVEQLMRMCIADGTCMLEDDELPRDHLAARGRAVVLEHVGKALEQDLQILFREACPFRQLG